MVIVQWAFPIELEGMKEGRKEGRKEGEEKKKKKYIF